MANLRVNTIKSRDGNNGPIFEGNLNFSSTAHIVLPKGTTAERPSSPSTGALRYNTDTSNVEYYNGTTWVSVSSYDAGARGVFGGGYQFITPSTFLGRSSSYINISGSGNALDFGNLTVARGQLAACSSSTRGVFGGGSAPGPTFYSTLDYITIATTGDATGFGSLSVSRSQLAACSSSTRGVFGGGYLVPTFYNTLDYITIATTGNATDFGDLTVSRRELAACSSSTIGVFGGGNTPTNSNVIDYITIASTGNATDFGDLTVARSRLSSCSSSTRGVFGGGYTSTPIATLYNVLDYITIASTGNATDFGDLASARSRLAACSSSTRGVFGGGNNNDPINVIEYITIGTTGDATNFGDLAGRIDRLAACSNAHGGLS